jgi:hypothetical protein
MERWSDLPFYEDLEHDDQQALSHTPLFCLRIIAATLKLDLFPLLGLRCAFCTGNAVYDDSYPRMTRSQILRRAREQLGLTPPELADRLEIYGCSGVSDTSTPPRTRRWAARACSGTTPSEATGDS